MSVKCCASGCTPEFVYDTIPSKQRLCWGCDSQIPVDCTTMWCFHNCGNISSHIVDEQKRGKKINIREILHNLHWSHDSNSECDFISTICFSVFRWVSWGMCAYIHELKADLMSSVWWISAMDQWRITGPLAAMTVWSSEGLYGLYQLLKLITVQQLAFCLSLSACGSSVLLFSLSLKLLDICLTQSVFLCLFSISLSFSFKQNYKRFMCWNNYLFWNTFPL